MEPAEMSKSEMPQVADPHEAEEWSLVAIESRLSGKDPGEVAANIAFAERACRAAIARRKNPFAMHLFYTRFLNDDVPHERLIGIGCGHGWTDYATEVWFFLRPRDARFSSGMKHAYEFHSARNPRPKMLVIRMTDEGEVSREDERADDIYSAS